MMSRDVETYVSDTLLSALMRAEIKVGDIREDEDGRRYVVEDIQSDGPYDLHPCLVGRLLDCGPHEKPYVVIGITLEVVRGD
jgi:hypothetical protein